MASLVKSVMLKIVADDADAERKLEMISLKADELAAKHPDLTPKIDIAAASAKMAILRAELKDTAKAADQGRGGIIGKALFGVASGIESFGNLGTTFINPITIALAGLAAILTGPLIAGLVPITAGFAAFGIGGVAEIRKVMTAQQQYQQAQQAFEKATTATARKTALRDEKLATEDLTGSEKQLLPMMSALGKQFGQLQAAIRPVLIQAFGTALSVLRQIMPTIIPLAVAAGRAVNGFLEHIREWLNSSSGQKFLTWMQTEGPKAIETFGRVMWDVAQGVGRTFTFLRNAGDSWYRNVTNGVHTIIHWFDTAKSFISSSLAFVRNSLVRNATDFNNWVSDVVQFGGRVISWFSALPGRIVGALAGLVGELFSIGQHIIQGLVNGIESMAGAVLSAVSSIASSIPGKIASFLGIGSPSRVMYQHGLWIAQGLAMGIEAGTSGVTSAAAGMAGAAAGGPLGTHAAGGGRVYQITVNAPPPSNPADIGRQIVTMIREFERSTGTRWRTA